MLFRTLVVDYAIEWFDYRRLPEESLTPFLDARVHARPAAAHNKRSDPARKRQRAAARQTERGHHGRIRCFKRADVSGNRRRRDARQPREGFDGEPSVTPIGSPMAQNTSHTSTAIRK